MQSHKAAVMVSPFDAGHRNWRMGAGPHRLLAAGLLDVLTDHGLDAQRMDLEPARDDVPSELRVGFTVQRQIAAATTAALRDGRFPVLLAGDCNASVGVVAGLQQAGITPAFLWCDAHADFHTPETDQFGSLDSQGLSMLTGRAWRALIARTGLRPLPDSHVALVGAREVDPAEERALAVSAIWQLSVQEVQSPRARIRVLDHLAASGATGIHLHIDADVLDPSIAPANDYAQPDGLLPGDLSGLTAEAASLLGLTSLSVASYDPRLDADGDLATVLLQLVGQAAATWALAT